jgi:hypothetical protein
MSNYSEYTVRVSTDPSYYGSDCTQADANRISDGITKLVEAEFPGVSIIKESEIGGRGVSGPDQETVDEISDWISTNWTAAF